MECFPFDSTGWFVDIYCAHRGVPPLPRGHPWYKEASCPKHEEAYPAGLKYLEDARDTNLLFLNFGEHKN